MKKHNFAFRTKREVMRTYHIILANAKVRNGNRGCVALTLTAMYLVRSLIKDSGNEVCFYLPDSEDKEMGRHRVRVLDEEIEYVACGYPVPLSYKGYLARLFRASSTWRDCKIFRSADLILDIGQGDSFTDIYGPNRFNIIDRIHRTARFFGKPYCLLPQTIGPFRDKKMKQKACKSIKRAVLTMARDKQSLQFIHDHVGQDVPVTEVIDVAFFMPYKKQTFCEDNVHVGLNVSALLWHGGYNKNNQFGLTVDYPALVTHIIDFFLSQPRVIVHLVPHVVNAERMVENDYAVCYDLCERYASERLVLAPFFLSPIDAKNYISGLDFFMGARMHSTIAAFSSGVAVLPMAYSRKFGGLFADTLRYPYVADMTKASIDEVMQMTKECFARRQELRTEITDIISTRAKAYLDTFNAEIRRVLQI